MSEKKLVDFLRQAQKLKLNLESIGRELVKSGWPIKDVDEALRSVKRSKAPEFAAAAKTAEARPKTKDKTRSTGKEVAKEDLSGAEKTAIERIKKMRAQELSDEQIWAAFVGKGWKADVVSKLIEKVDE